MNVLVVDDDPVLLEIMCEFLVSSGDQAIAAENALSALRIAQKQGGSIDAVVSDVEMPGMNGPEMWQQLKPLVSPACEVLFITGSGDKFVEEFPELKHAVLMKPFPLKTLQTKLAEMSNTDPPRQKSA